MDIAKRLLALLAVMAWGCVAQTQDALLVGLAEVRVRLGGTVDDPAIQNTSGKTNHRLQRAL